MDVILPILGAVAGAASPAAGRGLLMAQRLSENNRERKLKEWQDKEFQASIADVMGGDMDAGLRRLSGADPRAALSTVLGRGRDREEDAIKQQSLDAQRDQVMDVISKAPPDVRDRLMDAYQANPDLGGHLAAQFAAGENATRQPTNRELLETSFRWAGQGGNPADAFRIGAGSAVVDPSILETLNHPDGTPTEQRRWDETDIRSRQVANQEAAERRRAAAQEDEENRRAAEASTPEGVKRAQQTIEYWGKKIEEATEEEAKIREDAEGFGFDVVVSENGDGSYFIAAGTDASPEQRRLLQRLVERKTLNDDKLRRARSEIAGMRGGDDPGDFLGLLEALHGTPRMTEEEYAGQRQAMIELYGQPDALR
jgi:hypothetical protein